MQHQHGRRERAPAPAGYFGLPALKPSQWKWMVASYIWLAGVAGALQILAGLVLLVAHDLEAASAVTRPARYGALLAASIGTVLLIADLMTPQRFMNMLRILRLTSPMSFGSYLLVAFSVTTGLTVLLQLGADLQWMQPPRWVELLAQAPAAALGTWMVVYTASLLSATSNPLWAAAPGLLAGSFAGFSMAGGAAALSLWGLATGGSAWDDAFEGFAIMSLAVAWAFLLAWCIHLTRVGLMAPLMYGAAAWLFVVGTFGVGLALPAALHLWQAFTPEALRWATALAAVAELTGSLMWRGALLIGGQISAQRPADALRFAGGDHLESGPAEVRPGLEKQPPQGQRPYWMMSGLSVGGILALALTGALLLAD